MANKKVARSEGSERSSVKSPVGAGEARSNDHVASVLERIEEMLGEGSNDHLYLTSIQGINELTGMVNALVEDAVMAEKMTVQEGNSWQRRASVSAQEAIAALLESRKGEEYRLEGLRQAAIACREIGVQP